MVQKRNTNVSWEDLEAILIVSRSGSMRNAAQTLGISHTTIARRVANAERSLGVVAFVRGQGGHTLTDTGLKIVEHAKEMENAAENMKRVVLDSDQKPSGLVRVTLPLPILTMVVSDILDQFYTTYPDIQIEFQVGQSFADLENYGSDIAIRFQNAPSPDLVGIQIGEQFEGVYGDKDLIKSIQDKTPARVPFVAWGDEPNVSKRLATHGFTDVAIRYLCDDVDAQTQLAAAGHGLALLPCLLSRKHDNLILFPGTTPVPAYAVWVLTHSDLKSSERIKLVSRFLSAGLKKRAYLLGP